MLDTVEKVRHAADVMTAYSDGAVIRFRPRREKDAEWTRIAAGFGYADWDWGHFEYEIEKPPIVLATDLVEEIAKTGTPDEVKARGDESLFRYSDLLYFFGAFVAGAHKVLKNCRTVRHVERGSSYRVWGIGRLQSENKEFDNTAVTIYVGEDNRIWVRPTSEFEDGRFEDA